MNFKEHYAEHDKVVNIPLRLENIFIDEDGSMEVFIGEQELPKLVNEGAIVLHKKGKSFKNFNEAIDYSNTLLAEAEDELPDEDVPVVNPTPAEKAEKEIDKKKGKKSQAGKPEATWVDETGKEHKFEYSLGNAKIGNDTIIINMSSAKGCMSLSLGLCTLGARGQCYALNPEQRYPEKVGAYRERQAEQWHCMTPLAIADVLKKIKKALPSIKYVRMNEAGEFRNIPKGEDNPLRAVAKAKLSPEKFASLDEVDDIAKLKAVAKMTPELQFYTYSHRSDLFPPGNKSGMGSNVVINGSGYMIDNAFKPVSYSDFVNIMNKITEQKSRKLEVPGYGVLDNVVECIGNCAICNRCKVNKGWNIVIAVHGGGTERGSVLLRVKNAILANPEFDKVLGSNKSKEQKIKTLLKMGKIFDPKEDLKYLFRSLPDRKEFWENILNSENIKNEFLDALIGAVDPISTDVASSKPSTVGAVASLDALQGKLEAELKKAIAGGKQSSIKLKKRFVEKLKTLRAKAKAGEEIAVGEIPREVAQKYKTASSQLANAMKRAKKLKAKYSKKK